MTMNETHAQAKYKQYLREMTANEQAHIVSVKRANEQTKKNTWEKWQQTKQTRKQTKKKRHGINDNK